MSCTVRKQVSPTSHVRFLSNVMRNADPATYEEGCSATFSAAAVAPAAPCDQFSRRPVGLNRSAARACHFCPAAQPRTFLKLAAVTLTIGRPLSAAANSVMASALIASMEDLNRPDDDPRSAIVDRR